MEKRIDAIFSEGDQLQVPSQKNTEKLPETINLNKFEKLKTDFDSAVVKMRKNKEDEEHTNGSDDYWDVEATARGLILSGEKGAELVYDFLIEEMDQDRADDEMSNIVEDMINNESSLYYARSFLRELYFDYRRVDSEFLFMLGTQVERLMKKEKEMDKDNLGEDWMSQEAKIDHITHIPKKYIELVGEKDFKMIQMVLDEDSTYLERAKELVDAQIYRGNGMIDNNIVYNNALPDLICILNEIIETKGFTEYDIKDYERVLNSFSNFINTINREYALDAKKKLIEEMRRFIDKAESVNSNRIEGSRNIKKSIYDAKKSIGILEESIKEENLN